jgi:hypothetical protein
MVPLLILLAASGSAHAFELNEGIHGMAWASPISRHPHLTLVRESGGARYYVDADTVYSITNQAVPGVIYGFYKERFFAVFIRMSTPNQFYYVTQRFNDLFGAPKISAQSDPGETVYRWKDGEVKIKMKVGDAEKKWKLGIYYAPLSSRLNEIRLESIPDEAFIERVPKAGAPLSPLFDP